MLKAMVVTMAMLVSNIIGMNVQASEMDIIHFIGYDELESWNISEDDLQLGTMAKGTINKGDSIKMESVQYIGLDKVQCKVKESIEYNTVELNKELD